MMENEDGPDIGELHRERITIGGDRYLIYYTFANSPPENASRAGDSEEQVPVVRFEK